MDPVPWESFPKCCPVISPCLLKPEWGDPSKFQFNLAFHLGFPEFTDLDYKHYAMLLDRISDLDILFGHNLLKPEQPPSKRLKHCAYAEEVMSAASTLKDVPNHKQFGPIITSPDRVKAVRGVIPSNTESNTHWAVKNFNLCTTNHLAVKPSDPGTSWTPWKPWYKPCM